MSRKRVRDFECTLSQSTLNKDHVYYALEALCSKLLVAEEAHFDGGRHFHIYIRMDKSARCNIIELRSLIESNLYPGEDSSESIHISSVRNAKHWIKYCTKEDTDPKFKNVDVGLFHQSWKIWDYVRSNERFDMLHPFVRSNPSLCNILSRQHAQYWSDRRHKEFCNKQVEIIPDNEVEWVRRGDNDFQAHKHIYLWGSTGVGKSTWIGARCRAVAGVVYVPCGMTPFEFSDVDFDTKYVIANDAPSGYLRQHRSTLLQLCDNAMVSINAKLRPLKQVLYSGVVVVVSNFEPDADEALLRRFSVIEADRYAVQKIVCPKTEIPEDVQETICISSTSDEEEEV